MDWKFISIIVIKVLEDVFFTDNQLLTTGISYPPILLAKRPIYYHLAKTQLDTLSSLKFQLLWL